MQDPSHNLAQALAVLPAGGGGAAGKGKAAQARGASGEVGGG